MPGPKKENLWQRWEEEVKKFQKALKLSPPDTTGRHWQRYLMFIFIQELNRNVLSEKESLDSILDRIIEAIQVACGFKRVRVYLGKEEDRDKKKLYLFKTSKGHKPMIRYLELEMKAVQDDTVDTLLSKKPMAVDDAAKLHLVRIMDLKIEGPYAVIPLLVENKPYGLICADTAVMPAEGTPNFSYPESKEYFHTFARTIMAAIENRLMFEQRNQKIRQFEMVKEFNELIESETDRKKLLNSFIEHCVKSLNASGGHLKLYNKETKRLEAVAEYGVDVTPLDIIKSEPVGIGFPFIAFKSKRSILINDLPSHPLMKYNIEYYERRGHKKYLEILGNRKSSLIVPLIKHTGKIYGVLDLHSRNENQFTERDKENLLALASNVTYAVDKASQLERRDRLLSVRGKLHTMFQRAVEEAHDLKSVLEIIRNSCFYLENIKDIKKTCLVIEDPKTGELKPPINKCVNRREDCILCLGKNPIIIKAFDTMQVIDGKNEKALPICIKGKSIGVLYLQSKHKIRLCKDDEHLLNIITNTAAILITTARDYEKKIKQSTAFYEVGKLSNKKGDFSEWFNPVMERVLDIIGRSERNFCLVMVEEYEYEKKLCVRATSPLFIDGEPRSVKPKLLGMELPMDDSLSGLVVKTKKSQIIHDVDKNLSDSHPDKIPYFEYDERIKSEVGIPLKIKEGKIEMVIGVLIIDSVIPNDFKDFDLKFHETIANYLATIIHNQQLYEERARIQEELSRIDRTTALSIFINAFLHDFKNPLSEINAAMNLLDMNVKDPSIKKYIHKAQTLSEQMLSIYDESVKNFPKPVNKREIIEIQKLVEKSLKAVEKTTGLGIEPKLNYNGGDFRINCYPTFIELAFRSIINNAIKFSKQLSPHERYLEISVNSSNGNDTLTTVFESGTVEQIPEEKLESIFKPFERVITWEQGSGLGLALADLCVKMHNGDITAENVPEKKAVRFKITLPRGTPFERRALI